MKKGSLTEGWNEVARAHNFQLNYCLLLACVGHLQFDLFIFDQNGCELNYEWSTTVPIEEPNAPAGWNAELAMSTANRCEDYANCSALHG